MAQSEHNTQSDATPIDHSDLRPRPSGGQLRSVGGLRRRSPWSRGSARRIGSRSMTSLPRLWAVAPKLVLERRRADGHRPRGPTDDRSGLSIDLLSRLLVRYARQLGRAGRRELPNPPKTLQHSLDGATHLPPSDSHDRRSPLSDVDRRSRSSTHRLRSSERYRTQRLDTFTYRGPPPLTRHAWRVRGEKPSIRPASFSVRSTGVDSGAPPLRPAA
jgi:hypothetical protein